MNILIVGLGNMGMAIGNALSKQSCYAIFAIDPMYSMAQEKDSITIYPNLDTASANLPVEIDVIILAVKPQIAYTVLHELKQYLDKNTLIISTVAGITMQQITHALYSDTEYTKLARIMPTIAAKTQESITGISFHITLDEESRNLTLQIISSFGKVLIIPEEQISAITGVAGSGIAFVATFIEALTLAGVREGLSYNNAYTVALQTVRGALSLLEKDDTTEATFESPSAFIHAVCSPGGTTIEGIHTLHDYRMPASVLAAVHSAANRSRTLNNTQS